MILSTGGVSFLGRLLQFFGGVFFGGLSFLGGCLFWGVPPNFWGVGGWFLQIFLGGCLFLGGVPPNFPGGVFFGGVAPNFWGGCGCSASTHPTGTHSC